MPPQKMYFISGLGADKRVFALLELPANVIPIYIEWVQPIIEDTIASYAKKLLRQIDSEKPVILLGLSFGGMIALELSKLIRVSKLILLSSAVSLEAIPSKYKLLHQLKLLDKVPFSILRRANAGTYYFFGVKEKIHKSLLKEVLSQTDEHFFRWAIDAIMSWNNNEIPPNTIQINGTKDRLIPYPLSSSVEIIKIEGGGHFMVLEEAEELSVILQEII